MPKGLVRYQQCGSFHFVTFGCYHRFEHLGTADARNLFERSLEVMRIRYAFVVAGYVVMPDHIHLLLTPQGITIERAMGLIKGGFSHRIGSKFPVWQRGFTDHRVRDRNDFETRRNYIHQNPVRAGIVELCDSYPYSSAYRLGIKQATEKPPD